MMICLIHPSARSAASDSSAQGGKDKQLLSGGHTPLRSWGKVADAMNTLVHSPYLGSPATCLKQMF